MPQTTSITVENIVDTAIISRVRLFSATGTITSGAFIVCDASGGAFTITLPPAISLPGRTLIIIKDDATANVVTIDGSGSETINGVTTQALNAQYDSFTIRSKSTEWLITAST